MLDPLRPIYICGSTASGKSSLAISLAKLMDGEIVNGDAYQIYRGIETLAASPSAEELSQAPHHLFGILDTHEDFDAQRYRLLAEPVIADIQTRGKVPIVVGGSGMYLKFLTHGPSPVPAGDEDLRAELDQRSLESLIEELTQLDPEGAAQTNLKNRRYVTRALEICLLSGQPMSAIKNEWAKANKETEKSLRGYLLQWDRDTLRDRILTRTNMMMDAGAISEVETHPDMSSTCEKAIGVRDIRAYLAGEIDHDTCRDRIFYATCQYAKRQRTWFKKETWLTTLECPIQNQGLMLP